MRVWILDVLDMVDPIRLSGVFTDWCSFYPFVQDYSSRSTPPNHLQSAETSISAHEVDLDGGHIHGLPCECTGCTKTNVLWTIISALCAHYEKFENTMSEGLDEEYYEYLVRLAGRFKFTSFEGARNPTPEVEAEAKPMSPEYISEALDLAHRMFPALSGSYVFRTVSGRFGCSRRPPAAGDHVCVVPGAELLHIVSADKQTYVGAAWVHGYMEDALFKRVQELGEQMEEVTRLGSLCPWI